MRRWISITTFVAAAAVATAPATGSAKTDRVRAVSCTLELFAQGAATPAGVHLGLTSCSRPFGSGLHYNSYTVTPTTPGNGTVVATSPGCCTSTTSHPPSRIGRPLPTPHA
ncbi:MAG: hypothetical protein LC790_00385 [Actinobacteria bacterium]|nr:hypothetical protein [Actinomycetota bacterium]